MTLKQSSAECSWGIIRYAPGSGAFPEHDAAGFDGWYRDREEALAVARNWVVRFPQWIVALVQFDQIWDGNGNFGQVRHRPLTERERKFCARKSVHRMPQLSTAELADVRDMLDDEEDE